MFELVVIFFTSFVIALSGAIMPGPLLTITISESTRRGVVAGPLLISGHAVLELLLVIALLLGLGPILKHPLFFMISAFLGGAIMFWMAFSMFRSLPVLTINSTETGNRKKNLPLTGALMSLANPYWIIWWATIGIAYIVQSQRLGLIGVMFFFVGHIAGDLIWYLGISIAVAKGKKLFTDKVYRVLIGVCGSFLVGFALFLVVKAIKELL